MFIRIQNTLISKDDISYIEFIRRYYVRNNVSSGIYVIMKSGNHRRFSYNDEDEAMKDFEWLQYKWGE